MLFISCTKNITTLGEGGMIYVKDNNLATKIPGLRHNGHCDFKFKRENYWEPAMGNLDSRFRKKWPYKFTLSEIQCGAGFVMLKNSTLLMPSELKEPKNLLNFYQILVKLVL